MNETKGQLLALRRIAGETAELSDEALVAACATGDTAALGALFDRFHVAVYRFASRLPTIDEAARDDLVQATFLEVRKFARAFRGASAVRTWILGIAANVARSQLRSEVRRRTRQHHFLDVTDGTPPAIDERIDRQRLMAKIADALAGLSRDHQIAFVLCDLEQLPGAETAKALGIPEGTLWRRLHTARRAIRVAIEEDR